ncbi:DUF1801 domain-containing protein [Pedobacter sp. KR3-3]|uniref:DUF1801 domain-containing protein n=1 Tax=Pedobacter albus TaxID=3113905 RepID=A0ABU7I7Z2_9SPHI|nr:DUF1801 domain-containing protein [Pedobacter sp. KR3-3]MEE1945582.1 DUF1801 domain-containing protein [Pedobacter sp. KR3-3]
MAKIKPSDQAQVDAFIANLAPELGICISTIRTAILAVSPDIGERIKWNHPNFYYKGAMKDSDPKEYKREIAVFNLHKGRIMLVFPSGAKVSSPLLTGDYQDGRRLIIFENLVAIEASLDELKSIVKTWLSLVEQ